MDTTTTHEFDLNTLKWSAPIIVGTRKGPRSLRVAPPTEGFWLEWRAAKQDLKDRGISVGRNNRSGQWEVCHWQPVPEDVTKARDAAIEASRADTADIDIPVPEGLEYLPFQRAGIAYASQRANVLIADEMGLGKTIQAIGVINLHPEITRVLVVCPASLKINWQRELSRWLVNQSLTIGIATSKKWPDTDIVIANYAILGKAPVRAGCRITWDLVIADEVHKAKNPKAARSKHLYAIKGRRRIFLTGTPILNRPIELQPIAGALDVTFANFWLFAKRYCNAHKNRWGWDFSGACRLGELQEKLRERIMVRRLKADVLKELPAKRRQVVELSQDRDSRPLVEAERREIEACEEALQELQAAAELAKAGSDDDYAEAVARLRSGVQVAFQRVSQARHDLAVAKVPAVIEHVRDVLESQECVLLFAHHHDVVDALQAAFGAEAVHLTGRDSQQHRQNAVDAFQDDPSVRVFVGSIQAAGVGLTLTRASHVIFAELDWVPGNLTQAEDRAHRIGQRDAVLIQHLVVEGSLDATMAKKIVAKQAIIDRALDREVEIDVPEVPGPRPSTHDAKRDAIAALADKLSEKQRIVALQAVQFLAARCDGARGLDGAGFNKPDARIGHALANATLESFSSKQAALAILLVRKYHRQLPDQLCSILQLGD